MLNRIILMGRLTRDPELRHTGSGTAVASFSLAVERDFRGKNSGEKTTHFIGILAWGQTGAFVCKYFADSRRDGEQSGGYAPASSGYAPAPSSYAPPANQSSAPVSDFAELSDDDGELPF